MERGGVGKSGTIWNLTKSDFEMPDKLDTRPSGSDLHHLLLVDMELCLVVIRDINDVAEGFFLPNQISSETVAKPDRDVGQYNRR